VGCGLNSEAEIKRKTVEAPVGMICPAAAAAAGRLMIAEMRMKLFAPASPYQSKN